MKNEDFILVNRLKAFCYKIDDISINFPKKEYVIREKIVSDTVSILEYVYYINALHRQNVTPEDRAKILSKINMLDFYVEYLYRKNILNEKVYNKLVSNLTEIIKLLQGWLKNYVKNEN